MDRTEDLLALIALMVHKNGGEFVFTPDEVELVRGKVIYQEVGICDDLSITLRLADRRDVYLNDEH